MNIWKWLLIFAVLNIVFLCNIIFSHGQAGLNDALTLNRNLSRRMTALEQELAILNNTIEELRGREKQK